MAEADSTVASMAAVDGKLEREVGASGWQRELPAAFFLSFLQARIVVRRGLYRRPSFLLECAVLLAPREQPW